MAIFTLPTTLEQIDGRALASLIFSETGVTITAGDVYYEGGLSVMVPDAIVSGHETEIQAIITNYANSVLDQTPTDEFYYQDAKDRLLNSAIADMTPEQIFTAMQNQMDSWTSLADARASLREWLPMMAAILVWSVRRDQ